MDLELTDDQLDLRDAVRSVLADACPPTLVRSVVEGTNDGSALWATLVGLDWPALGIAVEDGGLGATLVEVGIVVEELGRMVAPTPYLATVTQFVPAVVAAGSSMRLADVAAGTCTGAFAVAEDGRWDPESVRTRAERVGTGWRLIGTKSHVLDGARADEIVVVARGDEGLGLFMVPGDAVVADVPALVDPTMPIASVPLDRVEVGDDRVLLAPGHDGADAAVRRALDEATVAMTLSTVATARAIFEATVAYAGERYQFGRAIGSFQAVKHRLADCLVALERASALGYFALLAVAEDDPRRPLAVAMAAAAGRQCSRLLTRDGLQLHGAIGYTWEHDLHLYLKRAAVGEVLFGTEAYHRARVAELLGLVGGAA